MNGRLLRQILDKMMKGNLQTGNARVQVCLLKYTKTNKVTFSPHQIAFHVKHPKHTFILVEDACLKVPKLYEGPCIRKLAACGLKLEPKFMGYESCSRFLESLGA
jgi:hypothetical protein